MPVRTFHVCVFGVCVCLIVHMCVCLCMLCALRYFVYMDQRLFACYVCVCVDIAIISFVNVFHACTIVFGLGCKPVCVYMYMFL